jgi:hypothetical protein
VHLKKVIREPKARAPYPLETPAAVDDLPDFSVRQWHRPPEIAHETPATKSADNEGRRFDGSGCSSPGHDEFEYDEYDDEYDGDDDAGSGVGCV